MRTNSFLVRWGGGWAERVKAASVATVGRMESLLGLGALGSLAEVYRVADGQLDEFARARTQTDVSILPIGSGDTPYVGVHVGDRITVQGVPHRVLGFTVSEDQATGRTLYVPTLNDTVVLDPIERMAQAIAKMIPGTLGGRSKVAQPVVPVAIPRGLVSHQPAVHSFTAHISAGSDDGWKTDNPGLSWQDNTAYLKAGQTLPATPLDDMADSWLRFDMTGAPDFTGVTFDSVILRITLDATQPGGARTTFRLLQDATPRNPTSALDWDSNFTAWGPVNLQYDPLGGSAGSPAGVNGTILDVYLEGLFDYFVANVSGTPAAVLIGHQQGWFGSSNAIYYGLMHYYASEGAHPPELIFTWTA